MNRLLLPKPAFLLIVLLLSLLLASCGTVATSGDLLLQANQLYEQAQYGEAIRIYQELIQNGAHDAALYYNLGNACYKDNDMGCAILNYRRAQRLQPRDPDISANLTLARAQTVDHLEIEPKILPAFIYALISNWNTADESALIALAAWIILCLAISGLIWIRRPQTWLRLIILIAVTIFLLAAANLGIHMVQVFGPPQAVIQVESVEVRSGPAESYITQFELHAGAEIQVIETRNGWLRIQAPGNLQGWAPAGSLETLQVFSEDN